MTVIAAILMGLGTFFLGVGSLGTVRFPDFYTRAHSVGKADTLGGILLLLGMIVYHGGQLSSLKLAFIILFIAIANPTGAHALMRAALRSGVVPWMKTPEEDGATTEAAAEKGAGADAGGAGEGTPS